VRFEQRAGGPGEAELCELRLLPQQSLGDVFAPEDGPAGDAEQVTEAALAPHTGRRRRRARPTRRPEPGFTQSAEHGGIPHFKF
jgi:hypothetical protein